MFYVFFVFVLIVCLAGITLERTIHILFVPDEEIGGVDGMAKFVESEDFRALNVSVALDEGIPSPTNKISVCYGEREPWWLTVHAEGPAGETINIWCCILLPLHRPCE